VYAAIVFALGLTVCHRIFGEGNPNSMSMRKSSPPLGFTLLELIVAATILAILTLMALPLAQVTIKREKEKQLRHALWGMRDAIDRYKDLADRGGFQIKVDSNGYPPTLDDLVKGIDVQGKKMRFLRRIPVDPMTGTTDWGLRSMQDDPDSDSWGGQAVFDVYTKSEGTALDGTKYKDW
jgi:general secretion pathway protein G